MTLDMESLGMKRTPSNGEANNKLCNGIIAKKMMKVSAVDRFKNSLL
jgi:hypothetical protein